MKSSYTDGTSRVNRVCLRTEEDQSQKQELLLGPSPNRQRGAADGGAGTPLAPFACGLLRAEMSARTAIPPATRNARDPAWQAARAVPRGICPPWEPPTPTGSLSAPRLPRRKERAERLRCWPRRRADPLLFPAAPTPRSAEAGYACWQSEQRCQDTLQQATGARSCYVGTAGAEMTKRSPGEQSRKQRISRFRRTPRKSPLPVSSH